VGGQRPDRRDQNGDIPQSVHWKFPLPSQSPRDGDDVVPVPRHLDLCCSEAANAARRYFCAVALRTRRCNIRLMSLWPFGDDNQYLMSSSADIVHRNLGGTVRYKTAVSIVNAVGIMYTADRLQLSRIHICSLQSQR